MVLYITKIGQNVMRIEIERSLNGRWFAGQVQTMLFDFPEDLFKLNSITLQPIQTQSMLYQYVCINFMNIGSCAIFVIPCTWAYV